MKSHGGIKKVNHNWSVLRIRHCSLCIWQKLEGSKTKIKPCHRKFSSMVFSMGVQLSLILFDLNYALMLAVNKMKVNYQMHRSLSSTLEATKINFLKL